MTSLYNAYTACNGRTWNGAVTNTTSLSSCVDLFFNAGSMRGKDIVPMFAQALAENEDKALRILQWLRDVRGGAGERQLFRDALLYLEQTDNLKVTKVINKVPEIGRWDDLLIFQKDANKGKAYQLISEALSYEGNGLCAKWMPRKGPVAVELRKYMGLSPRSYRKLLVRLTNAVETQMCARQWEEIDFNKIPSLASARYANAFRRNSATYQEYLDNLKEGKAKVNASAVYPYDIAKTLNQGNVTLANEQWKALPDYLQGSDERILPMVDVSGSMTWGGGVGPRPIDVAVSLGLYLSERNTGTFKDVFMTFSGSPDLIKLEGTLEQRYRAMSRANWGFNTDIEKAFQNLLATARHNRVPQHEMPTTILILSDMEFDSSYVNGRSTHAFKAMREMYKKFGYKLPKIIFWNLNGRQGNVPVRYDQTGTAMVSGFSPAIMQSILNADDFTPEGIMNKAIMKERYRL